MAEVTVAGLRDYLGAGEESDGIISGLLDSAKETIRRATGADWMTETDNATAAEAVRVMVWLGFYAARGETGNTGFLERYLSGLLTQLQYSPEAAEVPDDG